MAIKPPIPKTTKQKTIPVSKKSVPQPININNIPAPIVNQQNVENVSQQGRDLSNEDVVAGFNEVLNTVNVKDGIAFVDAQTILTEFDGYDLNDEQIGYIIDSVAQNNLFLNGNVNDGSTLGIALTQYQQAVNQQEQQMQTQHYNPPKNNPASAQPYKPEQSVPSSSKPKKPITDQELQTKFAQVAQKRKVVNDVNCLEMSEVVKPLNDYELSPAQISQILNFLSQNKIQITGKPNGKAGIGGIMNKLLGKKVTGVLVDALLQYQGLAKPAPASKNKEVSDNTGFDNKQDAQTTKAKSAITKKPITDQELQTKFAQVVQKRKVVDDVNCLEMSEVVKPLNDYELSPAQISQILNFLSQNKIQITGKPNGKAGIGGIMNKLLGKKVTGVLVDALLQYQGLAKPAPASKNKEVAVAQQVSPQQIQQSNVAVRNEQKDESATPSRVDVSGIISDVDLQAKMQEVFSYKKIIDEKNVLDLLDILKQFDKYNLNQLQIKYIISVLQQESILISGKSSIFARKNKELEKALLQYQVENKAIINKKKANIAKSENTTVKKDIHVSSMISDQDLQSKLIELFGTSQKINNVNNIKYLEVSRIFSGYTYNFQQITAILNAFKEANVVLIGKPAPSIVSIFLHHEKKFDHNLYKALHAYVKEISDSTKKQPTDVISDLDFKILVAKVLQTKKISGTKNYIKMPNIAKILGNYALTEPQINYLINTFITSKIILTKNAQKNSNLNLFYALNEYRANLIEKSKTKIISDEDFENRVRAVFKFKKTNNGKDSLSLSVFPKVIGDFNFTQSQVATIIQALQTSQVELVDEMPKKYTNILSKELLKYKAFKDNELLSSITDDDLEKRLVIAVKERKQTNKPDEFNLKSALFVQKMGEYNFSQQQLEYIINHLKSTNTILVGKVGKKSKSNLVRAVLTYQKDTNTISFSEDEDAIIGKHKQRESISDEHVHKNVVNIFKKVQTINNRLVTKLTDALFSLGYYNFTNEQITYILDTFKNEGLTLINNGTDDKTKLGIALANYADNCPSLNISYITDQSVIAKLNILIQKEKRVVYGRVCVFASSIIKEFRHYLLTDQQVHDIIDVLEQGNITINGKPTLFGKVVDNNLSNALTQYQSNIIRVLTSDDNLRVKLNALINNKNSIKMAVLVKNLDCFALTPDQMKLIIDTLYAENVSIVGDSGGYNTPLSEALFNYGFGRSAQHHSLANVDFKTRLHEVLQTKIIRNGKPLININAILNKLDQFHLSEEQIEYVINTLRNFVLDAHIILTGSPERSYINNLCKALLEYQKETSISEKTLWNKNILAKSTISNSDVVNKILLVINGYKKQIKGTFTLRIPHILSMFSRYDISLEQANIIVECLRKNKIAVIKNISNKDNTILARTLLNYKRLCDASSHDTVNELELKTRVQNINNILEKNEKGILQAQLIDVIKVLGNANFSDDQIIYIVNALKKQNILLTGAPSKIASHLSVALEEYRSNAHISIPNDIKTIVQNLYKSVTSSGVNEIDAKTLFNKFSNQELSSNYIKYILGTLKNNNVIITGNLDKKQKGDFALAIIEQQEYASGSSNTINDEEIAKRFKKILHSKKTMKHIYVIKVHNVLKEFAECNLTSEQLKYIFDNLKELNISLIKRLPKNMHTKLSDAIDYYQRTFVPNVIEKDSINASKTIGDTVLQVSLKKIINNKTVKNGTYTLKAPLLLKQLGGYDFSSEQITMIINALQEAKIILTKKISNKDSSAIALALTIYQKTKLSKEDTEIKKEENEEKEQVAVYTPKAIGTLGNRKIISDNLLQTLLSEVLTTKKPSKNGKSLIKNNDIVSVLNRYELIPEQYQTVKNFLQKNNISLIKYVPKHTNAGLTKILKEYQRSFSPSELPSISDAAANSKLVEFLKKTHKVESFSVSKISSAVKEFGNYKYTPKQIDYIINGFKDNSVVLTKQLSPKFNTELSAALCEYQQSPVVAKSLNKNIISDKKLRNIIIEVLKSKQHRNGYDIIKISKIHDLLSVYALTTEQIDYIISQLNQFNIVLVSSLHLKIKSNLAVALRTYQDAAKQVKVLPASVENDGKISMNVPEEETEVEDTSISENEFKSRLSTLIKDKKVKHGISIINSNSIYFTFKQFDLTVEQVKSLIETLKLNKILLSKNLRAGKTPSYLAIELMKYQKTVVGSTGIDSKIANDQVVKTKTDELLKTKITHGDMNIININTAVDIFENYELNADQIKYVTKMMALSKVILTNKLSKKYNSELALDLKNYQLDPIPALLSSNTTNDNTSPLLVEALPTIGTNPAHDAHVQSAVVKILETKKEKGNKSILDINNVYKALTKYDYTSYQVNYIIESLAEFKIVLVNKLPNNVVSNLAAALVQYQKNPITSNNPKLIDDEDLREEVALVLKTKKQRGDKAYVDIEKALRILQDFDFTQPQIKFIFANFSLNNIVLTGYLKSKHLICNIAQELLNYKKGSSSSETIDQISDIEVQTKVEELLKIKKRKGNKFIIPITSAIKIIGKYDFTPEQIKLTIDILTNNHITIKGWIGHKKINCNIVRQLVKYQKNCIINTNQKSTHSVSNSTIEAKAISDSNTNTKITILLRSLSKDKDDNLFIDINNACNIFDNYAYTPVQLNAIVATLKNKNITLVEHINTNELNTIQQILVKYQNPDAIVSAHGVVKAINDEETRSRLVELFKNTKQTKNDSIAIDISSAISAFGDYTYTPSQIDFIFATFTHYKVSLVHTVSPKLTMYPIAKVLTDYQSDPNLSMMNTSTTAISSEIDQKEIDIFTIATKKPNLISDDLLKRKLARVLRKTEISKGKATINMSLILKKLGNYDFTYGQVHYVMFMIQEQGLWVVGEPTVSNGFKKQIIHTRLGNSLVDLQRSQLHNEKNNIQDDSNTVSKTNKIVSGLTKQISNHDLETKLESIVLNKKPIAGGLKGKCGIKHLLEILGSFDYTIEQIDLVISTLRDNHVVVVDKIPAGIVSDIAIAILDYQKTFTIHTPLPISNTKLENIVQTIIATKVTDGDRSIIAIPTLVHHIGNHSITSQQAEFILASLRDVKAILIKDIPHGVDPSVIKPIREYQSYINVMYKDDIPDDEFKLEFQKALEHTKLQLNKPLLKFKTILKFIGQYDLSHAQINYAISLLKHANIIITGKSPKHVTFLILALAEYQKYIHQQYGLSKQVHHNESNELKSVVKKTKVTHTKEPVASIVGHPSRNLSNEELKEKLDVVLQGQNIIHGKTTIQFCRIVNIMSYFNLSIEQIAHVINLFKKINLIILGKPGNVVTDLTNVLVEYQKSNKHYLNSQISNVTITNDDLKNKVLAQISQCENNNINPAKLIDALGSYSFTPEQLLLITKTLGQYEMVVNGSMLKRQENSPIGKALVEYQRGVSTEALMPITDTELQNRLASILNIQEIRNDKPTVIFERLLASLGERSFTPSQISYVVKCLREFKISSNIFLTGHAHTHYKTPFAEALIKYQNEYKSYAITDEQLKEKLIIIIKNVEVGDNGHKYLQGTYIANQLNHYDLTEEQIEFVLYVLHEQQINLSNKPYSIDTKIEAALLEYMLPLLSDEEFKVLLDAALQSKYRELGRKCIDGMLILNKMGHYFHTQQQISYLIYRLEQARLFVTGKNIHIHHSRLSTALQDYQKNLKGYPIDDQEFNRRVVNIMASKKVIKDKFTLPMIAILYKFGDYLFSSAQLDFFVNCLARDAVKVIGGPGKFNNILSWTLCEYQKEDIDDVSFKEHLVDAFATRKTKHGITTLNINKALKNLGNFNFNYDQILYTIFCLTHERAILTHVPKKYNSNMSRALAAYQSQNKEEISKMISKQENKRLLFIALLIFLLVGLLGITLNSTLWPTKGVKKYQLQQTSKKLYWSTSIADHDEILYINVDHNNVGNIPPITSDDLVAITPYDQPVLDDLINGEFLNIYSISKDVYKVVFSPLPSPFPPMIPSAWNTGGGASLDIMIKKEFKSGGKVWRSNVYFTIYGAE